MKRVSDWNKIVWGDTYQNHLDRKILNLEIIKEEIKRFHDEFGKYPNQRSKENKPLGSTWVSIDSALRNQLRGIRKTSSLAELVAHVSGEKHHLGRGKITKTDIIKEIRLFYDKNGKYPNVKSADKTSFGLKWPSISRYLKHGCRGLEDGSSLSQLVEEISGIPNSHRLKLTEKMIKNEIISFYSKFGKYPTSQSKENKPFGSTWMSINGALRSGSRGLEGDSSLYKLVCEISDKHVGNLNKTEIIREIALFNKKFKKCPTKRSKENKPFGSTWGNIDDSLRKGFRGLKGGSSLSKLVKEVIKDSN